MRPFVSPKTLIVAFLLLVPAAYAPGQAIAQDGSTLLDTATRFTADELSAYIAGKTQVWDQGGAYYAEDGSLETLWAGDRDSGTWSVTDDGALCWHIASWGTLECEAYFHNGDVISATYEGETFLAPEIQDGNTLDALQAGEAAAEAAANVDPYEGKTLLTPDETTALVSGKTVLWEPDGAAYYAPDQTLHTIWNGVRQTGTWSVNDEGAVCWHIAGWGPTPCESYYYEDGNLMAIFNNKASAAAEHVEGDQTGMM